MWYNEVRKKAKDVMPLYNDHCFVAALHSVNEQG